MPTYQVPPKLKESLAEPIVFELKGETFTIAVVPRAVTDVLTKMAPKTGEAVNISGVHEDLIRAFIGQEAFVALGELDMREVLPLGNWLMEQVTVGLSDQEKNSVTT